MRTVKKTVTTEVSEFQNGELVKVTKTTETTEETFNDEKTFSTATALPRMYGHGTVSVNTKDEETRAYL